MTPPWWFKLNNPQPTMLQCMALWPVYPVRADIIAKYGNNWTDRRIISAMGLPFDRVGTSDHLTFKPNPNYWGTKPKLAEIDFKEITDANAALALTRTTNLISSVFRPGTEKTF